MMWIAFMMSSVSKWRVRFDDNVKVYPLITWDYASRVARQGPWMQYARDCAWFKRRIQYMELMLAPILNAQVAHQPPKHEII